MNRRFALALLLVSAAGFATVGALPSRADTGPPPTTTTAPPVTTTTTPTTTTAVTTTTAAKKKAAKPRTVTKVASAFPAAGELSTSKVPVRYAPSPRSRVIKVMHQFRPDYRIQVIMATAVRTGTNGKPWYRISVPMRPNGTYGWIPAASAKLTPTPSQIVIHRNSRTIDIYWHHKLALHAIVAVGAPHMETPVGHYFVAARFVPYHDTFLGVFAVETSAYSKLTEWPGGGVVGIHGTSAPQLLGQAVSHGCVRVSNVTAAALRRLAPLGTPIWITD